LLGSTGVVVVDQNLSLLGQMDVRLSRRVGSPGVLEEGMVGYGLQ
jgi:hypothetical protein